MYTDVLEESNTSEEQIGLQRVSTCTDPATKGTELPVVVTVAAFDVATLLFAPYP